MAREWFRFYWLNVIVSLILTSKKCVWPWCRQSILCLGVCRPFLSADSAVRFCPFLSSNPRLNMHFYFLDHIGEYAGNPEWICRFILRSFVPELRCKLQKSGRFRVEISVHFVPLNMVKQQERTSSIDRRSSLIIVQRSTTNNLLDKGWTFNALNDS
jgi:hypothetical protein